LALVVLLVVGQRLDAVRAVLARADVVEVAARIGVHRSTLHRWIARYLSEQLRDWPTGPIDRCRVEVSWLTGWRSRLQRRGREHPRWGPQMRLVVKDRHLA
jgi:hypothetical protein